MLLSAKVAASSLVSYFSFIEYHESSESTQHIHDKIRHSGTTSSINLSASENAINVKIGCSKKNVLHSAFERTNFFFGSNAIVLSLKS